MTKKKVPVKKPEATHIHILLDRTGSMDKIKTDTIGGFNTFMMEQRKLKGKATVTLVQFDDKDPYEVIYKSVEVKKVPDLTERTFVPRGWTPLLDAIGRSINDIQSTLGPKSKKRIVLVIITDGQENASKEYRKEKILSMVEEVRDKGWQIVFLGADLSGINDAAKYGISAMSTMSFDPTTAGVTNAYASLSRSISQFRSGGQCVAFSQKDRDLQDNEKKRKGKT